MKFTFKTAKSTVQWSSFYPPTHYIKLKGLKIGSFSSKAPFKIRLMIIKDDIMEDGNPNCAWRWITLKKEFLSLQDAKDFLNENVEGIISKYKLNFKSE